MHLGVPLMSHTMHASNLTKVHRARRRPLINQMGKSFCRITQSLPSITTTTCHFMLHVLSTMYAMPCIVFSGSCCNLTTCSLLPPLTLCREAVDSICDVPEFCDGMSQYCPEDVLTKNGKFCHNKGRGVCLFGKCNSHSSQCADIWGG